MRGDVVDEVMRTSGWKGRTSNSVPTEPAPFRFLLPVGTIGLFPRSAMRGTTVFREELLPLDISSSMSCWLWRLPPFPNPFPQ